MPQVSVVIMAYNQARYLARAVRSVLRQSFQDWECLIVDDGSTDDTAAVAAALCQLDPRITYHYQPNGGAAAARNTGVRLAQSEWVQLLDADDWIAPDKLERQLAALNTADPAVQGVFSDYERVHEDGQQRVLARYLCRVQQSEPAALIQRLLICPDRLTPSPFPLLNQAMLMRRSLLQQHPFDETLKACVDREFGLRIVLAGAPLLYVPMVAAHYTKHPSNLTNSNARMQAAYHAFLLRVGDRHPHLLPHCQLSLQALLQHALQEKDWPTYRQLLPLVQQPLPLLQGRLPIPKALLPLAFGLRCLIPNFLLYERYRGPRSRRVLGWLRAAEGLLRSPQLPSA